jgi:membrane complex biogenesis BtpA family protein
MGMYKDDQRFDAFHELFGGVSKPIIGMVHLKPLPGSPLYEGGGLLPVIERALKDAESLAEGGVDGLEVENFSDPTYTSEDASPELVASMAIAADHIHRAVDLPLGVCLLADPKSAIGVAHAAGAQFIRATFFTEASVDVSGLVLPKPHDLLRYRKYIDPSIMIFADVHIKHSAPLVNRPLGDSALDAKYFLADAILISGTHTGKDTSPIDLLEAKEAVGKYPVLVGSGFNAKSAERLLEIADGAIVGTALKRDGISANPVDIQRVKQLMRTIKDVREMVKDH